MTGARMDDQKLEVSFAVMQEQMRVLTEDSKEARHARKNAYMAQEKQNELLLKIEHRLEKVEGFVTGASPTLAELQALKMKVAGAGVLGKWLWFLAGVSISAAAAIFTFAQKFWGH